MALKGNELNERAKSISKAIVRQFKASREACGNYEVYLYSLLHTDCRMSLFSCNRLMIFCGDKVANAIKAAAF